MRYLFKYFELSRNVIFDQSNTSIFVWVSSVWWCAFKANHAHTTKWKQLQVEVISLGSL